MRHNGNLNGLVDKFYQKTYGKVALRDDRIGFKKQKEEKCSLISVQRSKRESLPPIIRKALKYLYPAKVGQEVNPVTEYDKALRNLSEYSTEFSNKSKRFFQRKKRSLDDIYEYKPSKSGKSNSQEYINCLGYNGQAESEYMMTKQGIKEYNSVYNLILQDSGLRLEKTRLNKSPRRVKEKYF
jgi:hypothetical protein